MPRFLLPLSLLVVCLVAATSARAACVNRFVYQKAGPRISVTLLTGMLTFEEAQKLANEIKSRKSQPVQWLDDDGKVQATMFGELKIVRPMPVACEGKASGVVMTAVFPTPSTPRKTMRVRLADDLIVLFDAQND